MDDAQRMEAPMMQTWTVAVKCVLDSNVSIGGSCLTMV